MDQTLFIKFYKILQQFYFHLDVSNQNQQLTFNQYLQDNQIKEDQDGKKTKFVTFCFEKNIIHSIYKCPSEYLSKKKKKQLSRRISSSIRSRWYDDQTSSDEETKNYSDLEDYEHFYSIIEWKNLQEVSQQKMTPNNLKEDQNSKYQNDFKDGSLDNPKSCLRKIKKLNILLQFDELNKQDQNDDQQTEVCSEKFNNKDNLQNRPYIIVSKFKDRGDEEDDEEISINLDDLEEFECNVKEERTNEKQDISMLDQIRKKIDFKSSFQIIDKQRLQFIYKITQVDLADTLYLFISYN
ncbi:unnamed protein product [Paramecium sonneborni]|uniref:Uncharacterized protein n=1 Tax=Paramecium sonneborni TaxID=65129 RepID=A0A8S1N0Z8_9CILI|nr:unnamed protein product [Paramecium sonneborni]